METTQRHRTRVKVCGITRLEDALLAAELGADAVGFVFYPKSPRHVTPEHAAAIIRQMPPFVTAVGLFVNAPDEQVAEILTYCPLDVLQLHGDESPERCEKQKRRVLKAVPVSSRGDLERVAGYNCSVLLDAKAPPGVYGGTGETFDWSLLEGFSHAHPLILAGGLTADNVGEALSVRQWFAVDVSSGVESSPGVKDAEKLRAFFSAVRAAEVPAGRKSRSQE